MNLHDWLFVLFGLVGAVHTINSYLGRRYQKKLESAKSTLRLEDQVSGPTPVTAQIANLRREIVDHQKAAEEIRLERQSNVDFRFRRVEERIDSLESSLYILRAKQSEYANEQQKAIERNTNAVLGMQHSIDLVVRDVKRLFQMYGKRQGEGKEEPDLDDTTGNQKLVG